ncbi:MAG TPA: hypothetical protein VKK61_06215, partial [Tepidisphaeraceae bacterium]|nr:hypothetical protein [Tepidisphaeraceae bacterium]
AYNRVGVQSEGRLDRFAKGFVEIIQDALHKRIDGRSDFFWNLAANWAYYNRGLVFSTASCGGRDCPIRDTSALTTEPNTTKFHAVIS